MEKDNFNANVDFVRGQADIIVLSALADKDKYGLEILNTIQERSKGTYTLKQATLYNSLKRLEKSGYVTSYDGDVSNGAKRVYYGLTEQGREHLNNDKSYWEFCNFLMTNLVSDSKFDPDTAEKPFDPTEFRPLTRRNKPEQEKEKEVIIKYVEVVRTPEEMQARTNGEGAQQYVEVDKTAAEGAVLREIDSPEIVDKVQSAQTLPSQPSSVQPAGEYVHAAEDNETGNVENEENEDSSADDYVQSSFIDDKGELAEESVGATVSDSHIDSKAVNEPSDVVSSDTLPDHPESAENNADYVQNSSVNSQSAFTSADQQSYYNNNYGSNTQNEYVQNNNPSPLYQSNNYFDENNEVNYVTSFADLFNVEEDKPAEAPPEYDFMSMNEMVFKFQAKGVTIKPYNKKNTMEFYVNRYYYSNKLHFHTALIMFFIMAIEIVAAHFICNRTNPISNYWLFSLFAIAVYPIVRGVMYAIEPNKKSLANFNPKSTLLISLLPVITLPIVIALLGFVQFGANINDYSSMERSIILPCVLLFNIPCYFFVFALKYRTNKYHIN